MSSKKTGKKRKNARQKLKKKAAIAKRKIKERGKRIKAGGRKIKKKVGKIRKKNVPWDEQVADLLFAFIKPFIEVTDWLAELVAQMEIGMRRRRDYVLVLLVILALIILAILIPLLSAVMKVVG